MRTPRASCGSIRFRSGRRNARNATKVLIERPQGHLAPLRRRATIGRFIGGEPGRGRLDVVGHQAALKLLDAARHLGVGGRDDKRSSYLAIDSSRYISLTFSGHAHEARISSFVRLSTKTSRMWSASRQATAAPAPRTTPA